MPRLIDADILKAKLEGVNDDALKVRKYLLEMVIDDVETAAEWLPADHIPADGDPVLAEGRHGGRFMAKYDHMDKCWLRASGLHEAKVTRWLRLPEGF